LVLTDWAANLERAGLASRKASASVVRVQSGDPVQALALIVYSRRRPRCSTPKDAQASTKMLNYLESLSSPASGDF